MDPVIGRTGSNLRDPSALADFSDLDLITLTRSGDEHAYAVLWNRHRSAGIRAARSITAKFDPEDMLQEAFVRILSTLQGEGGPKEAFRPYLYAVLRSISMSWAPAGISTTTPLENLYEGSEPSYEFEGESLEKTITSRAFANLKPEWRRVLWYTEVEGMTPREIAPLLGMKANSIAALAYRAKEGLRVSWLQAHVNSDAADPDCKWYAERLGSYNRGTLGTKVNDQVEDHLTTCIKCSILVEEVDHLGRNLGLVLLPIFLGPTAAASFALPVGTAGAVQAVPLGANVRRLVNSNRGTIGIVAEAILAGSLIVAAIAVTSSPVSPVAAPVAALPGLDQPSTTEERPQSQAATPPPATEVLPETAPELGEIPAPQVPLVAPDVVPALTPSPATITPPVPAPTPNPEPPTPPGPEVLAPPAITSVLEQAEGLFLPVVSGTGVPGAQVAVMEGSKEVGSAIVAADGTWSTTPELTYGSDRPVILSAYQSKGTLTSAESAQSAPVTVKTPTIISLIQESNTASLEFDGPAGAMVEIFFDGVPTGNYHELTGTPLVRMIQNVTPGQHSVALRFVDRAMGRHGAQITTAFYLPLPENAPTIQGHDGRQ